MEYQIYLKDLFTNSKNIKNDEKNIINLKIFYFLPNMDQLVNKFLEFNKVKIYLYLNDLNLKEFPKPIFKLANLHKLILNSNSIKCIPDDISKLVNLEVLDIGDNKLTYISPEIFKLPKLQYLDISYNSFEVLPVMSNKIKILHTKCYNYNK
jgi:Leucine-rich repeat (LRR) protein